MSSWEGAHPEPPEDLDERKPLFVSGAGPWYRVHSADRSPLHFGTGARYRFDAPDGRYGVLYAADDAGGAFIETFGRHTGVRLVTRSELARRGLARIRASRSLSLVDLASTGGLARVGADARLVAGDRAVARRWSAALHSLSPRPDGIRYPARHDPAVAAVALFDHVEADLGFDLLGSLADRANETRLRELLERYGFGLLEG